MKVDGIEMDAAMIARCVEQCAVSGPFRAADVARKIEWMHGGQVTRHYFYERCADRGLQAARKAGEIHYKNGYWHDGPARVAAT